MDDRVCDVVGASGVNGGEGGGPADLVVRGGIASLFLHL